MTEISVSSRLILFCALFCLLGGTATAQILELEGDLRLQEQNGVVYVAPNQSTFEPFDRQVHIALHYGVAERNFYDDATREQSLDVIGISAYLYGEHFGIGMSVSYFVESENKQTNIIAVNDSLNLKASIFTFDTMVSLRFPVHFVDIFLNAGLTVGLLNLESNYTVGSTKLFSDSVSETGAGAFAEAGVRLFVTHNLNIMASARYTSMETSTDDTFSDEETFDMSGASFVAGLGYAF